MLTPELSRLLVHFNLTLEEALDLELGPIGCIGFDLCRVIRRVFDRTHKPHDADTVAAPPIPHAFTVLRALVLLHRLRVELKRYREGDDAVQDIDPVGVWIISRVTFQESREVSTQWFLHHNFHEMTGVPSNHVLFCGDRKEKGWWCEMLNIHTFVDDQLAVLRTIPPTIRRILFTLDACARMPHEKPGATRKGVGDLHWWWQLNVWVLHRFIVEKVRGWEELAAKVVPPALGERIWRS